MVNHLKCLKEQENLFQLKIFYNEVKKDQIRFMMLNRSNDVELDFDFDKVKEKKLKDNPVFYVQYALCKN